MRTLLIVMALALALAQGAPVRAETPTPTVAAMAYTFLPTTQGPPLALRIPAGTGLKFSNQEPSINYVPHDLYATDGLSFGTNGLVYPGQTADVYGVDALAPGEYRFHCTVHVWMHGVLIVS